MKRLLFLIPLFFILNSCDLGDDEQKFHLELLKIEEVVIPDTFTIGETYPIIVKYLRPTTCHGSNGIYYQKDLNIRTIAVQNIVVENDNCLPLTNELKEETFNFYVTNNGSYIFKFWQGKDNNGVDLYLEYEIPVVD